MEVLVLVDTKEVEASLALEDDGGLLWKEKKRRRVSFAHTDTVHLIPRNDDLQTPPSVPNADHLSIIPKPSVVTAGACANQSAAQNVHAAEPSLHSDLHVREDSADISRFTSDMDTDHGSWTDEDSMTRRNSFNGSEDDSGCFVHLGHFSGLEDDSIVNDLINEDITMDASTFSRNLSYYLKSDPEGTCTLSQVVSDANANHVGSQSDNESISLTTTGAPHWALVHSQDVSLHADGDQSDMSLATGTVCNATTPTCNLKNLLLDQTDHTITRNQSVEVGSMAKVLESHKCGPDSIESHSHLKHSCTDPQTLRCNGPIFSPSKEENVVEHAQDISLHADDAQRDMSLSTGTIFNTTLPMRNLKDLLLDQTDYTITRKQPQEVTSTGKKFESHKIGSDGIQSYPHSKPSHSDLQKSGCDGLIFSLSKNKRVAENAQDISLDADDAQSDMSVSTGTIFNTTLSMRNFKDLLNQTDHAITSRVPIELVSRGKMVEFCTFESDSMHSYSHMQHLHSDSQDSDLDKHGFALSEKEVLVETAQDLSLHADDSQSGARVASKTVFDTAASMYNLKSLLSDQIDQTTTQEQSREVSVNKNLEPGTSKLNAVQSHSHSKYGHSQCQCSDCKGSASSPSRKKVSEENEQKLSCIKADQIMLIRDALKSNHADAGKEAMEGRKVHEGSTNSVTMTKVFADVEVSNTHGNVLRSQNTRCIEDILKDKTSYSVEEAGEANIMPLLPTRLQTLGDYLQFSCNLQPQMDCMREHVHESEAKFKAAKKRNAEIKSSNDCVQKLLEEATPTSETKFSIMQSLVKKRWLLWKMKLEGQILAWLQESKLNLIKEYEAVHGKSQEILHLKESYSLIILYHLYQDARKQLKILKGKWAQMQSQIHNLASVYGHKVQFGTDISQSLFQKNLETQIQRLIFMTNILWQQQVMQSTFRKKGGKSLIDFSLNGMCSQSFQIEEGGSLPQVELSRSLHPNAIDMTFPCMNASLVFEYMNCGQHHNFVIQLQCMYQIIQQTNHLFGCLMDVLMEIRLCRCSFSVSCKFQMQKDKLVLHAIFLQSASDLKVTLTFDMVCMKRGLYPFDLKPAVIDIQTYGCPSNDGVKRKDMMARITTIQPGFPRLYRICRCVEELMSCVKECD